MQGRRRPMAITMSIRLSWLRRHVAAAHASVSVPPSLPPSSSPPATAAQTGVSASAHGSDPAGFAARIGLAGVIVGALLAGACALKQLRRNAQLAQQRQGEHFRQEQEIPGDATRTG